jgi:PAS domain S-box-containing protein
MDRPLVRWGLTLAAVAVCAVARSFLDPWMGEYLPYFTFYFAMLFAAWLGGLRTGLFATLAGALLGMYLFNLPRYEFQLDSIIERLDIGRFLLLGVGVSAISEALHRHRRRAEHRGELLRTTLASIGDGVITTDTDGRVTFLNPVAQQLTGWTQDSAVGQPLEQVFVIVSEETGAVVDNPALRAVREGVVVGLANHTLLLSRDGTRRPIDDSAAPIRDEYGVISGGVLVFRDVSAKRDAAALLARREAELRERHDELETIYATAPIGMSLLDGELRFLRINDRLAEMNGLAARDHIGRTIGEVLPKLAPTLEPVLRRVLETGEAVTNIEVTGETAAQPGVERTWQESLYPLRHADGRIVGINTVVVETTDRKRAEVQVYELMAALKEADVRKDQFLAILAHELRNPLAPLRNMLEIMKRADHDTGLLHRVRETMERQLSQLVRLVDDLMDVSRITRNRLELRTEQVNLASVVHHAVEAVRPFADASRQVIDVALPAEPLYLEADPARLAQVFSNLLNNACKYSEAGGRIALVAERQGSDVLVSVRDAGVGIPVDQLQSVFDMFTQIDRSIERSQGGLGIGLTLVRQLVEMHGGSVEARSEGEGKGSEMLVRLPVLGVGQRMEAPAAAAELAVVPRRFLVADDSTDAASSLAALLSITGHETRTAHDGLEALEVAESFRPDVVLLDIGMPRLNGFEACRRMREQPWARDTIIVALTGWGQDDDRRKSRQAGFDAHMVKPVDYLALMELLGGDGVRRMRPSPPASSPQATRGGED